MPQSHRSAFAKFRSGVAPLRIETGRYERLRVNEEYVHSVETVLKTNFMSCFNVRSMMRFANPFIDMHVHMKNRLIPMTKLRSFYFCSAAPT